MGPPLSKNLFGSSFEFGVWELGGQGWILEFGVGVVGLAAMARSLGWVFSLGLLVGSAVTHWSIRWTPHLLSPNIGTLDG